MRNTRMTGLRSAGRLTSRLGDQLSGHEEKSQCFRTVRIHILEFGANALVANAAN